MSATLSTGEQLDLTACEQIIRDGLETFIEVGQALAEIRDRRLYRATHRTFEEYCDERWILSRTRAYQLMDAAIVTKAVTSTIVDTAPPANVAQAVELAPLKDDEEAMVGVWRELREQHGDRVNAHLVKMEVGKVLARRPKVECPGCRRTVLVERIDAPRRLRPGTCRRCGNKLPVGNTVVDTVGRRNDMSVHYSSATDEWSTPQDLFDELDAEFGFETDVCALPSSAKCERYFTPEDDGLAQEWTGACWMNPPYGDAIVAWVRKAFESAQAGATVVCLVPARVDTGWWWDYCRPSRSVSSAAV